MIWRDAIGSNHEGIKSAARAFFHSVAVDGALRAAPKDCLFWSRFSSRAHWANRFPLRRTCSGAPYGPARGVRIYSLPPLSRNRYRPRGRCRYPGSLPIRDEVQLRDDRERSRIFAARFPCDEFRENGCGG
jgi:hypothetical protein